MDKVLCESVGNIFPRRSSQRRMIEDALREAFPEWAMTRRAEELTLQLTVLLRLGRRSGSSMLDWVEYFAGEAELTRAMAEVGYSSKVCTRVLFHWQICGCSLGKIQKQKLSHGKVG